MATKIYDRTDGQLPLFIKASEMRERGITLTTGYPALDELIGEMKGGQTYLFCGYDNSPFVDDLIHRLIVKACKCGKVAYLNSTDYYAEKTLVSANRLAFYAKIEGVEPSSVFGGVYFAAAYSELRQNSAAEALVQKIMQEDKTRLVVAHRMPAFFEDASDKAKAHECLNRSLSALWRISAEKGLIMVITAVSASPIRPICTNLTLTLANVITFFRESGMQRPKEVQATLVKHPAKKAPAVVRIGENDEGALGRIAPAFGQNCREFVEKLRKNYTSMLRDVGDRDAFELLLKEWDKKHSAIGNSEAPFILDALNLTANVHNKSEVQRLKSDLKEKDKKIADLERRLSKLEIEEQSRKAVISERIE